MEYETSAMKELSMILDKFHTLKQEDFKSSFKSNRTKFGQIVLNFDKAYGRLRDSISNTFLKLLNIPKVFLGYSEKDRIKCFKALIGTLNV